MLRLPVLTPNASLARPLVNDSPRTCNKTFGRGTYHGAARNFYRDPHLTPREQRRLRRVFSCQRAPRKSKPILRMHARRYRAAWHRRYRWVIGWRNLSAYDKAWAINTSSCESGRNPTTNTGNGYYGAFQFSASTAYAAGFQTLPHYTSLHEQDVRSVRWRNIAGASQWPVCGH